MTDTATKIAEILLGAASGLLLALMLIWVSSKYAVFIVAATCIAVACFMKLVSG